MKTALFYQLSTQQLDKIGNAMIFLSTRIPNLSKTKMLKLIYLLDEQSIIKSGIPFFNLQYKVWKLGPVAEEIFVELSDRLLRFDSFIQVKLIDEGSYVYPVGKFCDDEFSDNDMELMAWVSDKFAKTSAKELIEYTHRPNSPWDTASKNSNIRELLDTGAISTSEVIIDMGLLVNHDERKKAIYQQYTEEN